MRPMRQPTAQRPSVRAQAPQGRKKRVAVFDFDYATVKTSTAALFGSDIDVGKGISDLLVKNLVTDGTYSVIERKALDKILAEQNFSNSDRANPASAAKIGKILGLDAIIVGSITEFGNETKNRNIGGGGGGFGGFGIGGIGHKEPRPTSCSMRASWISIRRKFSAWPKARANPSAAALLFSAAAETGTASAAGPWTSVPATSSRPSSARP